MQRCATCQAELRAGAPFCAHCGAIVADPDAAAHDPMIGSVLAGKFRIHSLLGEGGMGKVYKAEQAPLGTDAVIKVLHPQLAGDPMVVKRFFREAQAASRVRHPNTVSVLDFGDSNGTLYIAMEFLRGRTLKTVLAQDGRFEPRRAVRVIDQVLDVLEAAHRLSIVHRDLKPDNIMVEDLATQRDFVKVLDFGIAKIVDHEVATKLTQTGMIFGTPQYMAPEQVNGDAVDGRTDLYAVGTILFELLVGYTPFNSGSIAMLLAEVVGKPAPPIATVRPDLPAKLAAIIDSALAKSPAQRPAGALDMKLALAAAITETLPPGASADTLLRPCPSCGQPLPVTAKFCGECGASTALAAAAAAQDKFADLRRFLNTGVMDELAQMKPRAAGQRRDLVVAVFDLGGAAVAGDDSAGVLAELYGELAAIAARRGGTFERHAGTGAIIAFGLHALHADDAERAVATALEVRDLIATRRDVEATCAIHGGAAVVEQTGSYSPAGDTVELPTRLAATVAAGKIVVSERVRASLHDRVVLRPVEAVRLKGRAAAVPIYEVATLRAPSDSPGVLARPPTVGRTPLLDAVARAADDAKVGRAIVISGEPGAGKTRVLEELAARRAAKHQLALRLAPHGRASRIEAALRQLAAALGGTTDGFRALGLGAPEGRLLARYFEGGGGREGLGEAEERLALVGALRAGIELLAARVPLALLVDDLHLAEPITSALVARCVTEPIVGVTTIVTTRPGYPLPWDAARAAAAGLHAIVLGALPDDAIAQLVAGALAPTPPPRELAAAIAARAGGSPLLALEALRALVDQGLLRAVGGRWTVTGDLASAAAPGGLRELFAARIDALPARARDVLACIAVFGEPIAIELLQSVCSRLGGGDGIDRELELLVARGLVARDDDGLRVAEPSARDVVTERLARDVRAKVHLAIAGALEAAPERAVADEIVAEHFRDGGDHARALGWYARAADDAVRGRQRQRAAAIVKKARELARAAGGKRRFADDTLRLGELLLELGDLPGAKAIAAEGVTAAHAEDDPELIGRMRRLRGRVLLALGELDAAQPELEAALNGALDARNKTLIAEVHADLGEAYEKRGDLARSIELMMSALELAQGGTSSDVRRLALRLLTALGRVCVRQKELDRAQKFLQQGLELARDIDDQLGASKVLGNLAGVYHARGDFMTAIKFVRRALDLSREQGDLVGVTRQLSNLGTLYAALGDRVSAASNYDAAYAAAQRCGWREGMAAAAAAKDRLKP